jgi:hypothetical protein
MWLLISFCVVFLLSNLCLAAIDDEPKNIFLQKEQLKQCKTIGEECQENNDCCSNSICYSIQSIVFFYYLIFYLVFQ